MSFGFDDVLFGVAINLLLSALFDLAVDPVYADEYEAASGGSMAYGNAGETAVGELAPMTSGGGTWRSGDVIDYANKLVLAGPVSATQTARDAIDSVAQALTAAEALLGRPLINDLTDQATGEITPVFLVTDNGPCFKSSGFARYIDSRPERRHIRTRRRSPQTTASSSATTKRSRSKRSGATRPPTAHR